MGRLSSLPSIQEPNLPYKSLGYVVVSPKGWREHLTASAIDLIHEKEKLLSWPHHMSSDLSSVFLCSVTGMKLSVLALGERDK